MKQGSVRSGLIAWLLLFAGVLIGIASLPAAWSALELANQEYFHFQIGSSRRMIYDIEINGTPVSVKEALYGSAISAVVMWVLAAGLIAVSWRIFSGQDRSEQES